ncbi:peptidylprolyl isomerase [Mariprofundus sp. KV]|uniref:FKBP-type peptidyl-prolyl cis-trans isomerase n=1 Tax=Mariprofundus sp. KV TaxID=2608715 RepID=UPI0015A359A4|nr:peptidylprolyl isomerase [Mariprofundus sp. KV]NWF37295.1 peptidylprolyl isomerase [Mariprofundus sp. KV]
MQISNNKVVSFHYTLTNDAGETIDSSSGSSPMVYLHGAENIIPGLESALDGKGAGDALKVTIEPADAYGEYNAALTEVVPAEMFQGVEKIEVGMQFQAQASEGVQVVRIAGVDGDKVTVDGNHPLAGERLHFDVAIEEVRDASEQELEHGHVHSGEECCG